MSGNRQVDAETQEMLRSFVSEALDSLDTNEPMVENIRDDEGGEYVNAIFRVFHTIKGLSGFFEMKIINKLTHEAETLLDMIRKKNEVQSEDIISVVYSTFDLLRSLLDRVNEDFTDEGGVEEADDMIILIKDAMNKINSSDENEPDLSEFLEDDNSESENDQEFEAEDVFLSDHESKEKPKKKDDSNDEMLDQYINDSTEQVEQIEKNLLSLEKNENPKELISSTFGLVHSLKGNSGFMGINEIEDLAFDMETILDSVRSGDLEADETVVSVLFSNLEIIATRLGELGSSSNQIPKENDESEDVEFNLEDENKEPVVSKPAEPTPAKVEEKKTETKKPQAPKPKAPPTSMSNLQRKDIRVETQKIDKLFDLVGELITIESMVANSPDLKDLDLPQFSKSVGMLNKITRELQEITMSVRMMPLEGLFNKMKRLVRDVSLKMGKKVEFHVAGQETEMDKNVIDEIADPLVHILRNAIDHGVETPEQRIESGKDETGHVGLTAMYEGNEILIIIEDDGKGINKEIIINKAIEKGILDEYPENMSDGEVYSLVFEPGFSTAKEVTDISGRGVGMDVVKKNIEKLRGAIDVESILGKGSRFTLRIPLTLAIIEAMVISIGDSMFALPILSVIESFKLKKEQVSTTMDGLEMVKVRDEVLPIVRLHEIFNKEPKSLELEDGIMIIIESRDKKLCVFADEIIGQQQAVVKSLTNYIGKVAAIMGCMILGDGGIGLIVDIESLVTMSENKKELSMDYQGV